MPDQYVFAAVNTYNILLIVLNNNRCEHILITKSDQYILMKNTY